MLAPLWPHEREIYARVEIVMRMCLYCGLEQNHVRDDERLTPAEAARRAPSAVVQKEESDATEIGNEEAGAG